MSEHVTEWLGAYHDGELRGARLRQVEQHLMECTACRKELEEMRSLSMMLQTDVPDGNFLPSERFVSNLALQLPRRSPPASRPLLPLFQSATRPPFVQMGEVGGGRRGWWLVPLGLLGIWLFITITTSLSSLVSLAADTGLLDGALSGIAGGLQEPAPQMGWFGAAMNLFGSQVGEQGRAALETLNDANLFVVHLAEVILPQALIAFAYLGWLLAWWLHQPRQPVEADIRSWTLTRTEKHG